jgi:CBS domain-containing protein
MSEEAATTHHHHHKQHHRGHHDDQGDQGEDQNQAKKVKREGEQEKNEKEKEKEKEEQHHDGGEQHQKKDHHHHGNGDGKSHVVGWTSLFTRQIASEICHRKLITVKSDDTVAHLLKVLSDNNILSCPVVKLSTHEFLGFVDTLDVAGWVLNSWKRHSKELEHGKFPAKEFFQAHVEKILNYSRVDPAVAVNEEAHLLDLIDVFTDPHNYHRLHRVAVVDKEKNLVGIISQSDLVAFAYKNLSLLPRELADAKIRDLKIGRSLIFVRLDSPFIDTLETLYQNRISGLALVDEEFHLSGNISTSDLRGISPSSFDYFLGSTLQFLVKGRKGPIKAPTSVPIDSTFEFALKTLHENKIHRIYVTNEYDRPQFVVSLGDIISRLI